MQVGASGAEWVMGSEPRIPFGGGSYLSSLPLPQVGRRREWPRPPLCYDPWCLLQRSRLCIASKQIRGWLGP